MPQPVKVRVSFQQDMSFLMRLKVAIEKDDKRSPAWKKRVLPAIDGLRELFLEAELEDVKDSDTKSRKKA